SVVTPRQQPRSASRQNSATQIRASISRQSSRPKLRQLSAKLQHRLESANKYDRSTEVNTSSELRNQKSELSGSYGKEEEDNPSKHLSQLEMQRAEFKKKVAKGKSKEPSETPLIEGSPNASLFSTYSSEKPLKFKPKPPPGPPPDWQGQTAQQSKPNTTSDNVATPVVDPVVQRHAGSNSCETCENDQEQNANADNLQDTTSNDKTKFEKLSEAEIANSAPCLASSKPEVTRSLQNIFSTRVSAVGRPIGMELKQKRSKSKPGSKESLHYASPRSSATLKSKSSMRSNRSRKDVQLDRVMSPSAVLYQLPKAGSTTSIKHDISNKQMSKFLSGFRRFQKTYFGDNSELFDSLKYGQSPKTLLIACCDSRVDPAIITDCEPGDLFIVRNVANLVSPYCPDGMHHDVAAALEFAVKGLKVSNIIVMGHTKCGGIAALMRGISESEETEFLGPWMKIAQKARNKVLKLEANFFGDCILTITRRHFSSKEKDIQNRACEHASILLSLENLVTYPWIREKLMNETISIHGWYFDFEDGELLALNPDTLTFEPLVEASGSRLNGLDLIGKPQHESSAFEINNSTENKENIE
ncbi:hypothetical protein HDU82_006567, partial [Entophlyctis luteolus]